MPNPKLSELLGQLERSKACFTKEDSSRTARLLSRLASRRFADAASLIRFHEILLFIRAYPHDRAILQRVERLLSTFHQRVEQLRQSGAEDMDAFAEPEVSGIAGTRLSVDWSYTMVRHLTAHHPTVVEIDWDGYEDDALLVDLLKLFLPFFEDGAYVEYPVRYIEWVRAAKAPDERDLGWLLRRIEGLSISDRLKSSLYDALKLYVRWDLGNSESSRTRMRLPTGGIFYHKSPLIGRSDVSLAHELEDPSPLRVEKLSAAEGDSLLALGRDAMAVRIRELHGFTYGDPERVLVADVGRGVRFFVWGVVRAFRLPLTGYHAALISKNGVPVGYAESLSLFERTEFGLNLFYTFREGESAWIYARLLRLFRQLMGVSVFSVEPYQVGFHNEEAIESGAFWFYRKLGFRPVRPDLAKVASDEERKIAARPGYRTSARVLRRLATGHMIYEAPSSLEAGAWDRFHLRHLGLAVQRRMAERFEGDERELRRAAEAAAADALGARTKGWNEAQKRAFSDIAVVLDLIPDLPRWSKEERRDTVRIILAKAGADEADYVRLLQRHRRLRAAIIRLGSQDMGLEHSEPEH